MSPSRSRIARFALVLTPVALAAALRWFPDDGTGGAIGGHVFRRHDEAHYLELVQQFLNGRFEVGWFVNPTFYAYVVTAITAIAGGARAALGFDASFADFVLDETLAPRAIFLVGRIVSIVASVLAVALVARLGRRLFPAMLGPLGATIGLIAALALATDATAIARAPLLGNESTMVLLALLAIDALVTARERPTPRNLLASGALLGLAAATKYSAGIFVVPFVLLLGPRALLALFGAAGAFLAGSFSVLLAPKSFVEGFVWQASQLSGYRVGEEARDERGFTLYLREFPAHHHGILFALVCAAALLAAIVVAARRRERALVLLLACVLPLYVVLGVGRFVSPRFLLPALPPLYLVAGWGIASAARSVAPRRPESAGTTAAARETEPRATALALTIAAVLVIPRAGANAAAMRAQHSSAPLAPLCRFAAAAIEPGDRVVEFSYPARDRLFVEADPFERLHLAPPPPQELELAAARLRGRGVPPRSGDLLDLLPQCPTLADLERELARRGFTKLVLHVPTALAEAPELLRTTVPNRALRECTYWTELFAWLGTLPVVGPELSSDRSRAVAVITLPRS